MIRQSQRFLFVLLLGACICFHPALSQADAPCELMWHSFSEFPGFYWTVLSGDWTFEGEHTSAGNDQWAEGYWAVSHSGVGDWNGNYRLYASISFGDELAGEITIFLKLGPDYKGYALSLDGSNDRVELWEAQINQDGTIDHLRSFVETEDFGLTADHIYEISINHYDKRELICKIDGETVFSIHDSTHPNGGVAIGYTGPGRGYFHNEMGGDQLFTIPPICFFQAASTLDSALPAFSGSGRYLLLLPLILIGMTGILHELRARAKAVSR